MEGGLDPAHQGPVALAHKGDGQACRSCPARAAEAVEIVNDVEGHVKVDYLRRRQV